MKTTQEHKALVEIGAKWLRRQGFLIVATEIRCTGVMEQPDVIGFREACAVVLEAKASHSDFAADRAKPHRTNGGLGRFRYFITPPALISADELPEKWGLLEISERDRVTVVRGPKGNCWLANDPLAFPTNVMDERRILYSIARRMNNAKKTIRSEQDYIFEERG